jgi:Transglutaminase-like superfamily
LSAAREIARRPWTYLLASGAALGAALRLVHAERCGAFDQTVDRLRRGRRFSSRLADPAVHVRVVNRMLPFLPPRRMGVCLKRSLLLLHLWSRCGLAPQLHLGFREPSGSGIQSHAWLTARHSGGVVAAGDPSGFNEAFVF